MEQGGQGVAVGLNGLSALEGRVYDDDFMFPITVLGASWAGQLFLPFSIPSLQAQKR